MSNNNYNATLQQKIDASLSFVKHTQVQIELLDLQERPIGRLEGEVISGGISVDGDSAIRRTLNMVFLTTDNNYKILETSNPLSLNKKIKVYIGIKDLQTKEDKKYNDSTTYHITIDEKHQKIYYLRYVDDRYTLRCEIGRAHV